MNRAVAYAYSFLSFLVPRVRQGMVKNVILFGSAARDEFTEESDIDLFIEVYDEGNADVVRKNVGVALAQFIKSSACREWKLRGLSNDIRCLVGILNEQSDLKRSLISDGLVLYGKYPGPVGGKVFTLFSFRPIAETNRRYRVFRKLFGRADKGKIIKGLVEVIGGTQISTRVFMVPAEQTPLILKLMKKEKVDYSMREIGLD